MLQFGLKSASASFQRLMERMLYGLHWKALLLYLDDIIAFAPDFQMHMGRLEEVFQRLQQVGLKLKPTRCKLPQKEVKYLSRMVGFSGSATDPGRVADIGEWAVPKSFKEFQAFLGTVGGYYRQYLQDFASNARPLHRLTAKEIPWERDKTTQKACLTMKEGLVTTSVLGYPDPTNNYILDTDVSDMEVGAVMSQILAGIHNNNRVYFV